jgi:hypothetical protein
MLIFKTKQCTAGLNRFVSGREDERAIICRSSGRGRGETNMEEGRESCVV